MLFNMGIYENGGRKKNIAVHYDEDELKLNLISEFSSLPFTVSLRMPEPEDENIHTNKMCAQLHVHLDYAEATLLCEALHRALTAADRDMINKEIK